MGSGSSMLIKNGAKKKSGVANDSNQPLDASDIKSLQEAKNEIARLRQQAIDIKDKDKSLSTIHEHKAEISPNTVKLKRSDEKARAAVVTTTSDHDYVMTRIPKTDDEKKLIYDTIKPNILFRNCAEEELKDLVDAFKQNNFTAKSMVIRQGDEGDDFFVVESGILEIFVRIGEKSTNDSKEEWKEGDHVGVPYVSGSAFGELALMYGSKRAATIRAKEACKLWSINRRTFRGITGQYKVKRAKMHLEFLRKVRIGNKLLGEVLKESEIYSMALTLNNDSFKKGDFIIREGERGDIFYIIDSGTVEVFKKDENDNKPIATLNRGNFFGEKALLSEDVRNATCIASTDVRCLYLMREGFVLILGDLQDLIDGKSLVEENVDVQKVPYDEKDRFKCDLADLEMKQTLGAGAFGRVKLVKAKSNGRTFALKILSKKTIVENGLQEHVLNEKKLLEEINHPFIITCHCAMQSERCIYFLLELLLGGELFKYLRTINKFPEKWSKFYSASVLMAYSHIHAKKIAYRDLKPENLVLDSNGYLKLVDFGLAKKIVSGKTWTLCGTPDYLAPEVILNEGHDFGVDYWALGVLIFEMTAGTPPFYADDPMEVYEKILSGHVPIPFYFSHSMSDLIRKLLKIYQSKRLGRTRGGSNTVMKHKWYSGFDWESLIEKRIQDFPIAPKVSSNDDASNFDYQDEDEGMEENNQERISWTPNL